jgi:hypothetical protein
MNGISGFARHGEKLPLPDIADWPKFDEARKALRPNLSRKHSAAPLWHQRLMQILVASPGK